MKNIGARLAATVAVAMLGIAGCASRPVEELVGKAGLANGALFRQAESVVMTTDREAAADCKQRRVARRVLVTAPEVVVTPHGSYETVPFTGAGTPSTYVVPSGERYSKFVERWTLRRCEAEVSYLVTYTPNGSGTDVTAELEK